MDRVKLRVSGTQFEFDRNILKEYKCPKLSKLCNEQSRPGVPLEFTVDRSALSFGSILEYCQTGELHMPHGVCPGAFRRELEFWEIDFDSLHECCLYRYQTFLDGEETRRQFLYKALQSTAVVAPEVTVSDPGIIRRCRTKVWNVIDNNENSLPAKLYFVLVSALVVLSICVLAYSTEPSMRRYLSKCELLDYLENIQHEEIEMVKDILGHPDCSKAGSLFSTDGWEDGDRMNVDNFDWTYYKYSWGWGLHASGDPDQKFGTADFPDHYKPAGGENYPQMEEPEEIKIHIPKLTVPKPIFNIIDVIVNVFFTIDFILRITSCPSVRRYFVSVINILDAFALLTTFIYIAIVSVEREYQYQNTPWLMLLEFAQVFRALRLFRVVKNVRASKVLGYSLIQDLRDMSLLVTLLFVGISTFAYLLYLAETRDTVISIPNAWYWAVVTMTTVGYGDISPKSGLGRVIASICAVCGVLLLSVTLPMFVNNFLTLYQYSCVNESIEKRKAGKKRDISENAVNNAGSKTKVTPVCISPDRPPSYKIPQKSSSQEIDWHHATETCEIEDM